MILDKAVTGNTTSNLIYSCSNFARKFNIKKINKTNQKNVLEDKNMVSL